MSALAQRTPRERLWLIGGIAVGLLIAVIGWLMFISPQRSDTDDVNARVQDVRLSNVGLQDRIMALQAESKDMSDVQGALTKAQLALPSTSGVPAFLRTLQSLGNTTGTDVVSLTVGAPTDVSSVAAGAPAAAAATPSPAPTTPAAAPSDGAPAAAGTGVYGLTIAAQVNGSTDELNRFLDKLQSVQPRAVLITQITEGDTGEGTSSGTSLQLTMQAFVAPANPGERSQLSAAATTR